MYINNILTELNNANNWVSIPTREYITIINQKQVFSEVFNILGMSWTTDSYHIENFKMALKFILLVIVKFRLQIYVFCLIE